MYFDGYNSKVDIAEKLILTEEEVQNKEKIKKDIIYKQIIQDIKEKPFSEWVATQLEYDDKPPGLEYMNKVYVSTEQEDNKKEEGDNEDNKKSQSQTD